MSPRLLLRHRVCSRSCHRSWRMRESPENSFLVKPFQFAKNISKLLKGPFCQLQSRPVLPKKIKLRLTKIFEIPELLNAVCAAL